MTDLAARTQSRTVQLGLWVALTAIAAVFAYRAATQLAFGFRELVAGERSYSAADLGVRDLEVEQWFDGVEIYATLNHAVYPPASYGLLYPIFEPLGFEALRWVWAGINVVCLVLVVVLLLRAIPLRHPLERPVLALAVLAIRPTVETLLVGQITIFVVAALTVALLLHRRAPILRGIAGAMAMIKPTISLPFVIGLLVPRARVGAFAVALAVYGAALIWAAAPQSGSVIDLHAAWLDRASEGVDFSSSGGGQTNLRAVGYGTVSDLFGLIGLGSAGRIGSIAILLASVVWSVVYRSVGVWPWIGMMAIVSRVWVYHLGYDDLVLVFTLCALVVAGRAEGVPALLRHGAWIAAVLSLVALLMPIGWRFEERALYVGAQAASWFFAGVVLAAVAEWLRRRSLSLVAERSGPLGARVSLRPLSG